MLESLVSKSFFRERKMIVLSLVLFILLIANLVVVFINLEARNYQVPTRYSDFSASPLQRDNWQTLYALPLFSVVSAITNFVLAAKIHRSRTDISLAVLVSGLFILFVNLYVSWSLLSLI